MDERDEFFNFIMDNLSQAKMQVVDTIRALSGGTYQKQSAWPSADIEDKEKDLASRYHWFLNFPDMDGYGYGVRQPGFAESGTFGLNKGDVDVEPGGGDGTSGSSASTGDLVVHGQDTSSAACVVVEHGPTIEGIVTATSPKLTIRETAFDYSSNP